MTSLSREACFPYVDAALPQPRYGAITLFVNLLTHSPVDHLPSQPPAASCFTIYPSSQVPTAVVKGATPCSARPSPTSAAARSTSSARPAPTSTPHRAGHLLLGDCLRRPHRRHGPDPAAAAAAAAATAAAATTTTTTTTTTDRPGVSGVSKCHTTTRTKLTTKPPPSRCLGCSCC